MLATKWVQTVTFHYVFIYQKVAFFYIANWYFFTHAAQQLHLSSRNYLNINQFIFSIFRTKLAQRLL